MRSSIVRYITGNLDWEAYQEWESTNWGQSWISNADSKDLQWIISRKCSEGRKAWINGWKWLANTSHNLYKNNTSLVPILVESLLMIWQQDWPVEASNLWVLIFNPVYAEGKEVTAIQCSVNALTFAFHNTTILSAKLLSRPFYRFIRR